MPSIRNAGLNCQPTTQNFHETTSKRKYQVEMQDVHGDRYVFYAERDHFGGINPGTLCKLDKSGNEKCLSLLAKANFFKSIKQLNSDGYGESWDKLSLRGLYFSGRFIETPRLGSRDLDGDGVRNDADVCPDVYGDFRGCPDWVGWRPIETERARRLIRKPEDKEACEIDESWESLQRKISSSVKTATLSTEISLINLRTSLHKVDLSEEQWGKRFGMNYRVAVSERVKFLSKQKEEIPECEFNMMLWYLSQKEPNILFLFNAAEKKILLQFLEKTFSNLTKEGQELSETVMSYKKICENLKKQIQN